MRSTALLPDLEPRISRALGPRVVRALVEIFDDAGINYAFLHGVERFPEATGRDVDLLVPAHQVGHAVRHAERHFRSLGWRFVAHHRANGHRWCFVVPPDAQTVFEFDLVPRLRWGPAIFTAHPKATSRIGSLRVDPWAAFAKRILMQLLGGGVSRLEQRVDELELTDDEKQQVPGQLKRYVSAALVTTLIAALERRDFAALRKLVPQLKRAILVRSLIQRPDRTTAAIVDWVRNEIAASRLARPIAPVVCVVGVDGVGKSSVIDKLIPEIIARLPVLQVERRHWRPRVLPSLASLVGQPEPWVNGASQPPRRTAGRGAVLRVLYYSLDFWLGGWWKDRPAVSQLRAVVYDRCALDMQVDPLRFGLPQTLLTRIAVRLLPTPDLVVLLTDTPDRIHARKGELSCGEIERQQAEWLALATQGKVHHVVTVAGSPHEVAREIADYVVDRFAGPMTRDVG